MYFNPEKKQAFNTHSDIRQSFENTTMPADLTDEILEGLGFYVVTPVTPNYDPIRQSAAEEMPVMVNGKCFQSWKIADLPSKQAAENQAAADAALIGRIVAATQSRIDAFAATRGYDGVNSISKYQNISDEEIAALPASEQTMVAKFRGECRYLAVVTAQTWAKMYGMLGEVQAGTRPKPSGFADVESELPVLEWPV